MVALALTALALLAARQPAFAAEPPADGCAAADARARQDLPPVSPAARGPDRRPHPAGARASAAAIRTCAARQRDALQGQRQLGHQVPVGSSERARRRHGRRAHRRGRRGLAGDPGRLGDGPRPRRLLRRAVREPGTSGSRSACCSCARSSTPAGRSGCCTSTCWCWSAASASRTSSSTRARSGRRCRSSTRCSPTSWCACWWRASGPAASAGPLVPFVPAAFLVAGIVLLGGFRIGLDLTERQGRRRGIRQRGRRLPDPARRAAVRGLRRGRPALRHLRAGQLPGLRPVRAGAGAHRSSRSRRPRTTTCRPRARPRSRSTRSRSSGLFLLGLRLRSRPRRAHARAGARLRLGELPLHAVPADDNGNDTLIAMLVVYALLALTSAPARGALIALAGAAKFAPLALAPLFATGRGDGSRLRSWISFSMVFALVMLVAVVPYIPADGGLEVFYDQTIGFQLDRESPFSVWGQNSGLEPLLWLVKVGGGRPRRRGGVRPPQARHAPGRRARGRGADRHAAHRDPLVLPLHRLVRARSCSWRCSASTRTGRGQRGSRGRCRERIRAAARRASDERATRARSERRCQALSV